MFAKFGAMGNSSKNRPAKPSRRQNREVTAVEVDDLSLAFLSKEAAQFDNPRQFRTAG
jgi:hypothetical protein